MIHEMTPAEQGYVIKSWIEALHDHHKRTPWKIYKPLVTPALRAVLAASTVLTSVLDDGVLAGWIAFERGPRVSAVHWIHTRYKHPTTKEPMRRRGVASELFAAAQLGDRIVYTHHTASPVDEQLALLLSKRGVAVGYVPYVEWKR